MYKEDKIVDNYLNTQRQADENRQRREENNRIKKETHKKLVSKAILGAITAAVITVGGAYATNLPGYINGQQQITDEFFEATSSYSVSPVAKGYLITKAGGEYTTTQKDFNRMVDEMILLAKDAGMTDEEVYVGLENKISDTTAKEAYGYSMDLSTKWETCTQKSNTKTR